MAITFRPGEVADGPAVYDVFVQATADLNQRVGLPEADNFWLDPAFVASYWQRRQSLFEHLARTADQFWVAEVDGQIVGFARSSERDGVRELLEFFVRPGFQGQGIGGELLSRAFPAGDVRRRAIIATREMRALARYMKAGVYPRFANYYTYRKPEPVEVSGQVGRLLRGEVDGERFDGDQPFAVRVVRAKHGPQDASANLMEEPESAERSRRNIR